MNHISDTMINQYIDGELDHARLREFNEHIAACAMCENRLKQQTAVESVLRMSGALKAPADFTQRVMSGLAAPAKYKQKNYFFRAIFGIFVLLGAAILAFVVVNMTEAQALSANNIIDGISGLNMRSMLAYYNKLINSDIVSVVGSSLTVILLVSAYFIYDSHRNMKNIINNNSKLVH